MHPHNSLKNLTKNKADELSKIVGIDSVPSTQLIAIMQNRLNNPLFKLSIADYEKICGNKMIIKMMSKVLSCEKKHIDKFCKYINIFKDNIKSSPKSIKNKMKITNSITASKRKGSLSVLPDDILEKIVNKYKTIFKIKYVLKDWIPIEKLDWKFLSINPNAIDLLKENPDKIIYWRELSGNPNAIDLLKENYDNIYWEFLSENPNAIELLRENIKNIDWWKLSGNPNAIELLKENQDNINWKLLSFNPNAIELLKENQDNINWVNLSLNPNAIELLKENQELIKWGLLSTNPNAIELLKENQELIDWNRLSENPNAIKLLKSNPTKINWKVLSKNPAIFNENLV